VTRLSRQGLGTCGSPSRWAARCRYIAAGRTGRKRRMGHLDSWLPAGHRRDGLASGRISGSSASIGLLLPG